MNIYSLVWPTQMCVTRSLLCVWLANGTLTAVTYRDEIIRAIVRLYAGAVGPGWINAIDWSSHSPDLNPIVHLWDASIVHLTLPRTATDCPGAHWCPDQGLGGGPPRTPSADSSGECPDVVGSAYRHAGAIHTTESHHELLCTALPDSWSCKTEKFLQ